MESVEEVISQSLIETQIDLTKRLSGSWSVGRVYRWVADPQPDLWNDCSREKEEKKKTFFNLYSL